MLGFRMQPPYKSMTYVASTGTRFQAYGLESVLAEVSRRSEDSLFLSGAWLRASIECWGERARYRVVEVAEEAKPPVWALIGQRTEVRHGFLPVRVLALNQSAIPALDQPWIERNGFYGGTPDAFGRQLTVLLERLELESGWDELRLGGLLAHHAHDAMYLAAKTGLSCRLEFEQTQFQCRPWGYPA